MSSFPTMFPNAMKALMVAAQPPTIATAPDPVPSKPIRPLQDPQKDAERRRTVNGSTVLAPPNQRSGDYTGKTLG